MAAGYGGERWVGLSRCGMFGGVYRYKQIWLIIESMNQYITHTTLAAFVQRLRINMRLASSVLAFSKEIEKQSRRRIQCNASNRLDLGYSCYF